jgi:DNA polymerase III subunit chi
MTEVAFHSGLDDKLGYACRLLRKAWRLRRGAVVTGSAEQLTRLDTLLWTFDPGEFLAHARLRSGQAVAAELERTPIWLVDPGAPMPQRDLLLNLGPDWVEGSERFANVIELVGTDAADRQAGRTRWRRYEATGLALVHHPRTPGA